MITEYDRQSVYQNAYTILERDKREVFLSAWDAIRNSMWNEIHFLEPSRQQPKLDYSAESQIA